MVLERNQHVELRPTIQQLFDMTQKVSRDLITVVQMVPRLALQATARQLRELEVSQQLVNTNSCMLYTVLYPTHAARKVIDMLCGVDSRALWQSSLSPCSAQLALHPPCLQERGEPPPKPLQTYYDVISSDEDATIRTIVQITTGITSVADPVQASLEHFEKR